MSSLPELALRPLARGTVYGALAKAMAGAPAFLNPEEFLPGLRQALSLLPGFDLKGEIEAVEVALSGGVAAEALILEHARLFVKGDGSPYETSYDSLRSSLKAHDLADIAGFYRAFGLERRADSPDYLVAELEFMGLAALKEAVAQANGEEENARVCREGQVKFLAEHLGRWLCLFSRRLKERARGELYPALSQLIYTFVKQDASFLGAQIQELMEGGASQDEDKPLGCLLGPHPLPDS